MRNKKDDNSGKGTSHDDDGGLDLKFTSKELIEIRNSYATLERLIQGVAAKQDFAGSEPQDTFNRRGAEVRRAMGRSMPSPNDGGFNPYSIAKSNKRVAELHSSEQEHETNLTSPKSLSIGIDVNWQSPFGPINIDIGKALIRLGSRLDEYLELGDNFTNGDKSFSLENSKLDEFGGVIDRESNSKSDLLAKDIVSALKSVADRWKIPTPVVQSFGARGALSLLPYADEQIEVDVGPNSTELPLQAPELYSGLRGPENPPEFVQRVYGPWLGHGLTRAHIRKLDVKLYTAIDNWLSRPGNEWPADVDLPTKAEQNSRLLEAGPEAVREHLGKFTGLEAVREGARIRNMRHRSK